MKKERKYSFYEQYQSVDGIYSTLIFGISALILVLDVVLSAFADVNGTVLGYVVGGLGLVAFVLSIYGFVLGIRSFSDRNAKHKYSTIGSIGTGVLAVVWLTLFLNGIGG